jgi:DNA-binding NtrC family response regulator
MAKKAIICVDDEAVVLLAVKEEVNRGLGGEYAVEGVLTAFAAMDKMKEFAKQGVDVVLVITDWLMPGVKGDVLLKMVREKFPGTQAIMITGQADEDAMQQVLKEGLAGTVLRKPWDAQELVEAIKRLTKEKK